MASAAAGQNRAFGVDRGLPFPVADIAETETLVLWGANCADTMPPIMQWVYEQRDRGGKLIVVDPRAHRDRARRRRCTCSSRRGRDLALANGLLHIAIRDGLVDEAYIAARTEGFEDVRRAVLTSDPAQAERVDRRLRRAAGARRAHAGRRRRSMVAVGPRPRAAVEGDRHGARAHQPDAGARQGRQAVQRIRLHHRAGQRPGRPRARPEGRPAPRLSPHRERSSTGREIARVWGVDRDDLPRKGKSAYELLDALGPEGGIRALLVFGSNVAVASPNASNIAAQARGARPARRVRRVRERDDGAPRTSSCPWRSGRRKRAR